MLSLSNNTGFSEILSRIESRFSKLYSKKVYVHHYTQFLEESVFRESAQTIGSLNAEYKKLADHQGGETVHRYKPLF